MPEFSHFPQRKMQGQPQELEGLPSPTVLFLVHFSHRRLILIYVFATSRMRWETRPFVLRLTSFHGMRSLHILGWCLNADSDSPSQPLILNPKRTRSLKSQASCQSGGQDLLSHGPLQVRLLPRLNSDVLLKAFRLQDLEWNTENAFFKLLILIKSK